MVCGNYKAIKSKNIKQKNVTKVPPTTVVKLHTEELWLIHTDERNKTPHKVKSIENVSTDCQSCQVTSHVQKEAIPAYVLQDQ